MFLGCLKGIIKNYFENLSLLLVDTEKGASITNEEVA